MDNTRYIGTKETLVSAADVHFNEQPAVKRKLKGRKNWMRNKPCTCGSGKKLKKCCWHKMAKVKV